MQLPLPPDDDDPCSSPSLRSTGDDDDDDDGSLRAGDIVGGHYRIVRRIGHGGMGVVYEGINVNINRRVAIKVLRIGFASDKSVVKRFEREAQVAARVGTSHVADVYDLGELPNGDRFVVMEFLEGESLGTHLRREGRLSARTACSLALDLLEGLARVHDAGVIHRDLKPANIFLTPATAGWGRRVAVKILDFGVCKLRETIATGRGDLSTGGRIIGTPSYMSPEQFDGSRTLDHRSDIYAVGVILYRCVTGRLPYKYRSLVDLACKLVRGEVMDVRAVVPSIDPDFAAIIMKAMSRDVTARFESCRVLQATLRAWEQKTEQFDKRIVQFLAGVRPPQAPQRPRELQVPQTPQTATLPVEDAAHAEPAERQPNELDAATVLCDLSPLAMELQYDLDRDVDAESGIKERPTLDTSEVAVTARLFVEAAVSAAASGPPMPVVLPANTFEPRTRSGTMLTTLLLSIAIILTLALLGGVVGLLVSLSTSMAAAATSVPAHK